MKKVAWLLGMALGFVFFSAAILHGVANAAAVAKLEDCRLIINWDTCNMWNEALYLAQQERKLDAEEIEATLE